MSTRTQKKGGTRKKRAPTRSEARRKPAAGVALPAGVVTLATPAPELRPPVAIHEPTATHQQRLADLLGELGYPVTITAEPDELSALLAGEGAPEVVIVGLPGGDGLLQAAVDRGGERPVTIAALAGPAATAIDRCRDAGADLFVLRPHSRDALVSVMHAAGALQGERRAIRALQATAESLRERLLRYGQADAVTGFQHFDFFQQQLVMELKRARRYRYPLAVCLVASDPWGKDQEPPAETARTLRTRVAAAISASIRDIDLPVDFAADRFLVLLPYTDIDGAEQVGRRVAEVVRAQGSVSDGDRRWRMSASVGIAATRAGKPVSFARLIRDATAALRAAQLKGGGRVVVRR